MKKNIVFVLLTIILTLVLGCTSGIIVSENNTETGNSHYSLAAISLQDLSLDETIARSHIIADITIIDIYEKDDVIEYMCKVNNLYKGIWDENSITICERRGNYAFQENGKSFSTEKKRYDIGNRYIVMVEKTDSVYFDNPVYTLLNTYRGVIQDNDHIVFLQEADNNAILDISNIQLKEYIGSIMDKSSQSIPYMETSSIDQIIENSEIIVTASIEQIEIEAPNSNRDTYRCKAKKVWKGDIEQEFLIVFSKGSVEVGKEYIVFINRISDKSLLYVISAKNAIIDVNDQHRVQNVLTILDNLNITFAN